MPDKPDPSIPSAAYEAMSPVWQKIQTLLDGTPSMRAARQWTLPRHENESDGSYEERWQRATLLNMTSLTLDQWVGRPFSDPVKRSEDMPPEVDEWMDDVDLQGNNVTTFARQWFREGLAKGYAHVLIDFPEVDKQGRTAADDVRDNLRPFMSLIRPEGLIFAEVRKVSGKETLTHVRIVENQRKRVGFGEITEERIRIFDRILPGETPFSLIGFAEAQELTAESVKEMETNEPERFNQINAPGVYVTTWIKNEDNDWIVEKNPRRIEGIDEIPLVTFYSVPRDEFMVTKPPLEDLADLNVNWFQSNSDQNHILTVARFPILAATGVSEEGDITIGPKNALIDPNSGAKFMYVEHEGNAIEAGRKHEADLEEQMGHYGAQFMKKQSGNQTATARALDSAEATSPLQAGTMVFEDALNTATAFMGAWENIENVGTLEIVKDFGPEELEGDDLNSLVKAREMGDISRPKFLQELHRRGGLADEFNFDENEAELKTEQGSLEDDDTLKEDLDPFAEK